MKKTSPVHSFPRSLLRFSSLCGVLLVSLLPTLASQSINPSVAVVAKAPTKVVIDGKDAFAVGFDKLSAFPYTIVDSGTGASPEEIEQAKKRDQVPEWIRIYHNKRVALTGYLMPLQVENGLAKKFVMMKDINTCCYGAVPNMNDYVVVSMKEGVRPIQDVPVELVGVLRVEEKYEGGYITALFQMEGEKFLGAKK